jgi:hypothetical protein
MGAATAAFYDTMLAALTPHLRWAVGAAFTLIISTLGLLNIREIMEAR